MELTAATTLTALWAVTSYYFWRRDRVCPRSAETLTVSADILIAYASQSGQARQLAERCALQLADSQQAFTERVTLRCLSQIEVADLAHYRQVFIIASTYGQGEAPDTARSFSKALASGQDKQLQFTSTQFAVLALGDSAYPHFCAFGHFLHHHLTRLGAQSMSPCIEVDRLHQAALLRWQTLLESTLNCTLSAAPGPSLYKLTDRRLLNPGSNNPGLFLLRLAAANNISPAEPPEPGDLIDIHLLNGERRTYSLANAPLKQPCTTLDLIVRQHYREDGTPGYGSSYLNERIDAGSRIQLTIRRGFDWAKVPIECPLILIAAGSGLAGVRAGLQARQTRPYGLNWLIFGERDPLHDRPCEEELLSLTDAGVLSRLDRVWSQAPDAEPLRYVQDVLRARATELSTYLMQGGYIYVCGSAQGLGSGVHDTLQALLGESLVATLDEQGRYVRDIY